MVGDRIELKTTSGGTVLIGVVEKIDPMRTVLRTDGTVPVAVPNKAITDMIVSNESRLGRSEVVTEFKVYSLPISWQLLPAGDSIYTSHSAILTDLRPEDLSAKCCLPTTFKWIEGFCTSNSFIEFRDRSSLRRTNALKTLLRLHKKPKQMLHLQDPRQYTTTFKIKNSDFAKVPAVLKDVLDYLKTAPGVDKLLPMSAKLQSLGDSSVTIGVTVSLFLGLHDPFLSTPRFAVSFYSGPKLATSTCRTETEAESLHQIATMLVASFSTKYQKLFTNRAAEWQAHTTAQQSREFQNFNHDVLMALADIQQKRGVGFV